MAIAFNNPKQLKKFKPESNESTTSTHTSEAVAEKLKDFGKEVFKMNLSNAQRNPHRQLEYAKITGKRVIFMNPTGHLFGEDAQPTTYENDSTGIIIRIDYDGNFI